jgi:hypothetical protein
MSQQDSVCTTPGSTAEASTVQPHTHTLLLQSSSPPPVLLRSAININQSITRFSSKRGTQEESHSQTTFGDS